MNKKINNFQLKVEELIKFFLIGIVIYASYLIYKPFLLISIWAIILTISFNSTYQKINQLLKGKKNIAAIIFTFILLLILVFPTSLILESIGGHIHNIIHDFDKDDLKRIKLPERIINLPYIGGKINDFWLHINDNIINLFNENVDEVKKFGKWIIKSFTSFTTSIFIFTGAVFLTGFLFTQSEKTSKLCTKTFNKIAGSTEGPILMENVTQTIKSVFKGVLGTAIIQTACIVLGFAIAGVPGTPILGVIILIFIIAQLPPFLIIIPVVIYMWGELSTFENIIFSIYCIFCSVIDNVIKPLLMGKGTKIPSFIIFMGSIGGMLLLGFIGLFIGALLLSIFYQLFIKWVD